MSVARTTTLPMKDIGKSGPLFLGPTDSDGQVTPLATLAVQVSRRRLDFLGLNGRCRLDRGGRRNGRRDRRRCACRRCRRSGGLSQCWGCGSLSRGQATTTADDQRQRDDERPASFHDSHVTVYGRCLSVGVDKRQTITSLQCLRFLIRRSAMDAYRSKSITVAQVTIIGTTRTVRPAEVAGM